MTFMRNEGKDCVCCEGNHVFCRFVKSENGEPNFLEQVSDFISNNAKEGEKVSVSVLFGESERYGFEQKLKEFEL